jgi:hypothetical protein
MRRDPVMHRISTSVMCELGRSVSREVIFAKICNHLEPLLKMDRHELLKLYKLHEAIQCGDKVKVYMQDNSVVNCTFRKVNDDWSVELIGCFTQFDFFSFFISRYVSYHLSKKVNCNKKLKTLRKSGFIVMLVKR